MRCQRCRSPMREEKRSFHKKRKWICPKCGRAQMQRVGGRSRRTGRGATRDSDMG